MGQTSEKGHFYQNMGEQLTKSKTEVFKVANCKKSRQFYALLNLTPNQSVIVTKYGLGSEF